MTSKPSSEMNCSSAPSVRQSLQASQKILTISHMLCIHTMDTEMSPQLKMASSFMAKHLSFHHQKGRSSSTPYMKDIWASAGVSTMPDTVCIGLILIWTLNKLLNHVLLANITTHRNHNSCCSQLQLRSTHDNTLALATSTLTV